MTQNGFGYSFDRAVIYQFFPHGTRDVGGRLTSVDSDHLHALLTSIDSTASAANTTSVTPPTGAGQGSVEHVTDTTGAGGCQPCPTGDAGSDSITLTSASTGPLHDAEVWQLCSGSHMVGRGRASRFGGRISNQPTTPTFSRSD